MQRENQNTRKPSKSENAGSGFNASNLRGGGIALSLGAPVTVVNRIGCEIVTGHFKPSARMPNEATMLGRYSISRTVLREAYSKLTAKGLIQARTKVGTFVRPQTDWNMLDADVLTWHLQTMPPENLAEDLFALRRMVEPQAVAIAATARSEDALVAISEAYEDMKKFSTSERDLLDADFKFHNAILSATGNHFIGAFSSLIHAAMLTTFKLSWSGAANVQEARLLQHGSVLDAIRDRDPDQAKLRMEVLLDDSIRDVRGALKQETS